MLIALLLGAFIPFQNTPVAIVLQVEGAPAIQHAGAGRAARVFEMLYDGDRVTAPGGAKITVAYCPTNQKLSLEAGSTVELGAAAFRTASGKAPQAVPFKCALPRVALGSENLERAGALRGRGDPPIPLYTGGNLTTPHPLLKWEPVKEATSYKLTVIDDNDDTRVWSAEKPAPLSEIAIDHAVVLKPGISYRWELTAEAGGKIVGRQSTTFTIKPNAELATIPADRDAGMLRAITLENAGYFGEAADSFRQLQARNPGDTRISRHLAWLYWNAGLTEAAKRELERRPPG